MRLTIKVCSHCDHPPTESHERSFDSFPIIVGRSSACDYSLNDASRYISSNHAVILLEDGQLVIEDTSANGVYVNGAVEPVGRGQHFVLHHEDTLGIGDYKLVLSIEHMSSSTSSDAVEDPFAVFADGHSGGNPDSEEAAYDPFRGVEHDWTPPSSQAPDPFADDLNMDETPVPDHSSNSKSTDSDWADWTAETGGASGDEPAVNAAQAHNSNPLASEGDFKWLPGSSSKTVPNSDSISEQGKSSSNDRSPVRPHRQSAESQVTPSRSSSAHEGMQRSARQGKAPSPPFARRSDAAPASRQAASLESSLEPMLRAASLSESDFAHLSDTEVLEQTGRLLAQMVDAMMVLLQSRTELKNAIRSDVTRLSRSDNNPLKFSVSTADALTRLLVNDTEGYLQADNAVQEAVDDLKMHQLAMLEGMKSAVRSLLLQFDPDKLAKKLEKKGGIAANIPITREAKLWKLFCEQYEAIHEEAISDFGELFGAEFRKAYEKRIRKLGRSPDF